MAWLLSGCAALLPQTAALREGLPAGLPPRVELKSVPFFAQEEYQCGPAALAMVLNHAGVGVTPEQLVPQVWIPERKGSLQAEMLAAARRHGLVSYLLAPRFEDLLRELAAGNPVVVLQNFGLAIWPRWHYAVAVGYDYEAGELLLHSGTTEHDALNFGLHELAWKAGGYWAMVALPPGRIPATAAEERYLPAIVALERLGNTRGARTGYEAFLARWPANPGAAIGLANTLYALGDLPGAEKVLRGLIARQPDSVIALNNLAQALSDQGRNREALELIERAAALGGPYSKAVGETRALIRSRSRP